MHKNGKQALRNCRTYPGADCENCLNLIILELLLVFAELFLLLWTFLLVFFIVYIYLVGLL